MSTSNRLVKTLSAINPDEMPSFSSIDASVSSNATDTIDAGSFFSSITWQTWLIIVLMLAFLGINIFSYLEAGTQATTNIFDKFLAPILKVFGYETLETTKQTVEVSATGAKAGVDAVANTTTGAINTVENKAKAKNGTTTTNTNTNTVTGKQASSSLSINNVQPVKDQLKIEKEINDLEEMQQQNLQRALDDAAKGSSGPKPDDALSRIQASNGSGKAGWCFIGEDRGFRTCSEIGQNDRCMSGDIFPSHEICMNPNLRP
jgi:hypothetical protein